jgi:hypothetical protein
MQELGALLDCVAQFSEGESLSAEHNRVVHRSLVDRPMEALNDVLRCGRPAPHSHLRLHSATHSDDTGSPRRD